MMKLEQAIEEKDVTSIQNILKAYLTSDPSDSKKTVKSALLKIEDKGVAVWEEHDGKNLLPNPWTEEDFLDLQVDLRMNFSEERFKHMLIVGEDIYGSEKKGTTNVETSHKEVVNSEIKQSKKSQAMKWGIMAIGAGIIIILLVKMINSNN